LLIWIVHVLILQGVRQAAFVSNVITVMKLAPVFLFLVVATFTFDTKIYFKDFRGEHVHDPVTGAHVSLSEQVSSLMLVTLWVFGGVESACVLSGCARKASFFPPFLHSPLPSFLPSFVVSLIPSFIISSNAPSFRPAFLPFSQFPS
jgi:amino acid transporter